MPSPKELTPEQLLNTAITELRRNYSDIDVLNSIYLKALEFGFENGFDDLSRLEALVVAAWLTWGAMGNGGVSCAMNNPYSLFEAADAMTAIGHVEAARRLRAGSKILFPNGQSTDRDKNDEIIQQFEETTGKDADDLFDEFASVSIDLTDRLVTYIYDNWEEAIASDSNRMAK